MTTIYRYSNRKLYNTRTSKYINLPELPALGAYKVICHKTKRDITDETNFALMVGLVQSTGRFAEAVKRLKGVAV